MTRRRRARGGVRVGSLAAAALVGAAACLSVAAGARSDDETLRTDSRAPYVHRIALYDAEGEIISPGDEPGRPWSPRATCGKCHDYARVAGGWHFNFSDPDVAPGRPAQAWILVDKATGTQLPLAYRGYAGAWTPEAVGMTAWEFVQAFGRHLAGGGPAEPDEAAGQDGRWAVSGPLEIDCMACHAGDASHDQSQRAVQVAEQNLAWVPTATLGLGSVRGSAKRLPDGYDPVMNPEFEQAVAPRVAYDEARFDADDRVLMDITRRPAPARCYFCHTNRPVGRERWETDEDVHLAAGLTCADCHRHGLDHGTARGYEGEAAAEKRAAARTLSCRGCHLGDESAGEGSASQGGRLGAPRPTHDGFPPVHFEKLACTACHSGPVPAGKAGRVQTSRAHGLGLSERGRSDGDAPLIQEPVFMRRDDGLIGPHRVVWPAFWGRVVRDRVVPMRPEAVVKVAERTLGKGWADAD